MGTFLCAIITLGVIIIGLAFILHPPTGLEIAKRVAKVVLALFAAYEILCYLLADRIGRLVLIGAVIAIAAELARRPKE